MEEELEHPAEEVLHIKTGKHVEKEKCTESTEPERYVGGHLSNWVAYCGIGFGFLIMLIIALSKELGMVF